MKRQGPTNKKLMSKAKTIRATKTMTILDTDTGQYSQFLQCFNGVEKLFIYSFTLLQSISANSTFLVHFQECLAVKDINSHCSFDIVNDSLEVFIYCMFQRFHSNKCF